MHKEMWTCRSVSHLGKIAMDINQVKFKNIVNAESGSCALNHNSSGNSSIMIFFSPKVEWGNVRTNKQQQQQNPIPPEQGKGCSDK